MIPSPKNQHPPSSRPPRLASHGLLFAFYLIFFSLAGPVAAKGAEATPQEPASASRTAPGRATLADLWSPDSPLEVMPLDEVRRGQKGWGLTVFAGREAERFEVEVVGVVRNNNPGSSFVVARLSGAIQGQRLEDTGVIRGMSGSPVFVGGRLVGAVAFSWAFTEGAVAGITPISDMRRLNRLPRPDRAEVASAAGGGPPVKLAEILAGKLPADLMERQLARLVPGRPASAQGPASMQWAAAGFGERSLGLLEDQLGAVAPMGGLGAAAGEAEGGSPSGGLKPGDPVAAVLIDGDLKLAAAGTVTDRSGDDVLAFGHPFLNAGPVLVPMAEAEVVTVVANQSNSFKLTNVGRHVGAFEQDRMPGIQGRLGVEAPMIPATVRVAGRDGDPDRVFRLRVAALPQLAPGLLAFATFGALDVAHYSGGNQGLDLDLKIRMVEHGELALRQSFDGPSAVGEAAAFLTGLAGYVMQNDLERVEVEEVEVALRQSDRPRTVSLVGAHAERSAVRPGQALTLNLDLLPYRGEPRRETVALEVPENAPEGRYFFFVGDGASIDAARLALEPAEPVSLRQALTLLRSLHSRRQLGVLGFFPDQGLSVAGEVMPRLPGSMASIWSAAPSGSATPLRLVVAQEIYRELEHPLNGLVRIDLEVRRDEPWTPDREDGSGDDGFGDGAAPEEDAGDGAPAGGAAEEGASGGGPDGGASDDGAFEDAASGDAARSPGAPPTDIPGEETP